MYAVLIRFYRGTTDVLVRITSGIGDDEYVSQDASTLGAPYKPSERHALDTIVYLQWEHTTFGACYLIICRSIQREDEICRGTSEVFLPISPWTCDDEYASRDSKHARHALQAIGTRLGRGFKSTSDISHLCHTLFGNLSFWTHCR